MSLEKSELRLRGKNKEVFLDLMRGMLQWRPEDRKTAKQLLEHPWLNKVIE
jgi:serine/threonine-protein kinase SRPK3